MFKRAGLKNGKKSKMSKFIFVIVTLCIIPMNGNGFLSLSFAVDTEKKTIASPKKNKKQQSKEHKIDQVEQKSKAFQQNRNRILDNALKVSNNPSRVQASIPLVYPDEADQKIKSISRDLKKLSMN